MIQRIFDPIAPLVPRLYALIPSLIGFAVYLHTLAPTVMWYDMGEFATASHVLGIGHNTGYPLYILLGKLFTFVPIGNIAYRVNLMSALFASLTVLMLSLVVRHITGSKAAAFVAALTIAFSSTLWSHATWAESYPLNAFLTLLALFLLLKWERTGQRKYLYILSLTYGLSLGNHRLILLLFPALLYLLFAFSRKEGLALRRGDLLRMGFLFLGGISIYLYLPLRSLQNPPLNWGDPSNLGNFFSMALTGNTPSYYYDFSLSGLFSRVPMLGMFPRHEFTTPGLLLALFGAYSLLRINRHLLFFTLIVVILTSLLTLGFMIHNIYNYFIPIYLMIGIWLGCGVHSIARYLRGNFGGNLASGLKILTPKRRVYLFYPLLLSLPLTLFTSNFHLLDRSKDYSAYDYALHTLANIPPNSVVVTDSWTCYPLWYLQFVEGFRRDVMVGPRFSEPEVDVIAFIREELKKGRSVYVAEGLTTKLAQLPDDLFLIPIALQAIESPVTNVLPRPEYKDVLVRERSIYQILEERPRVVVEDIPQGVERASFSDRLTLMGLDIEPERVARGGLLRLSYYWRLTEETDEDLFARILFTDPQGLVTVRENFPLWHQSYVLGGGLYPTSQWAVGETVKEEYWSLVPRDIRQGEYFVQLMVYREKGEEREFLSPSTGENPGVILGTISVKD